MVQGYGLDLDSNGQGMMKPPGHCTVGLPPLPPTQWAMLHRRAVPTPFSLPYRRL